MVGFQASVHLEDRPDPTPTPLRRRLAPDSSVPNPDREHLGLLAGLPRRIIFVAGAHRTGTSLLHRMLASAADVDFVTYYDVCEFPRLLEQRVRGGRDEAVARVAAQLAAMAGSRGIDQIPVGALEPEEYSGVLRRSCVGLDRCRPYSNPCLEPLRLLARKKAFLAERPQPLLLKGPIDSYDGLLRVDATLPDVTFVFVHRHPLPTLCSNVRSWRTLVETPNPWFAELDRGYRGLLSQPELLEAARRLCGSEGHVRDLCARIRTGMLHALEVEDALPAHRVVHVRYEDLCRAPATELARVLALLGLEQSATFRESIAAPRPEDGGELLNRIHDESIESWRAYLNRHGYADRPEA